MILQATSSSERPWFFESNSCDELKEQIDVPHQRLNQKGTMIATF